MESEKAAHCEPVRLFAENETPKKLGYGWMSALYDFLNESMDTKG
jgi:hypothetical protein